MIIKSIKPSSSIHVFGKLYNYVTNFSIRAAAVTFAYVSFYDNSHSIPSYICWCSYFNPISCQKMWSAYDVCCKYSNAIIATLIMIPLIRIPLREKSDLDDPMSILFAIQYRATKYNTDKTVSADSSSCCY